MKHYVIEYDGIAKLLGVGREEIQTEDDAVKLLKKWLSKGTDVLAYDAKSS